MNNNYNDLELQMKEVKEEISILRGRQNMLWGTCIVLTAVLKPYSCMYLFCEK